MRESHLPMPKALNSIPSPPLSRHWGVRVPGLAFRMAKLTSVTLCVLTALIALPATAGAAPDSTGAPRVEWERYRPRPLSIWITPAAGTFGKTLAMGGDLRFALASGWVASGGFTYGEEFCLFCDHAPEKFAAGSLLAGLRGVSRYGYGSIAAGPNWGWAERPDTNIVETLEDDDDPGCMSFLCHDYYDHPTVSEEGLGVQVQAQAALAGKYLGIGGQIQVISFPSTCTQALPSSSR